MAECEVCKIVFKSNVLLNKHLMSQKHADALKRSKEPLKSKTRKYYEYPKTSEGDYCCDLCNYRTNFPSKYHIHLNCKTHLKYEALLNWKEVENDIL